MSSDNKISLRSRNASPLRNSSISLSTIRSLGGVRPRNPRNKNSLSSLGLGNQLSHLTKSQSLSNNLSQSNKNVSPSVEAVIKSNQLIKQKLSRPSNEAKKSLISARGVIQAPDFSKKGTNPRHSSQVLGSAGNSPSNALLKNLKNTTPSIPNKYGPLFRPNSSTHSNILQTTQNHPQKLSSLSSNPLAGTLLHEPNPPDLPEIKVSSSERRLREQRVKSQNNDNSGQATSNSEIQREIFDRKSKSLVALTQNQIDEKNQNRQQFTDISQIARINTQLASNINPKYNYQNFQKIKKKAGYSNNSIYPGLVLDATNQNRIPSSNHGLPLNIDLLTKKLNRLAQQQQHLARERRRNQAENTVSEENFATDNDSVLEVVNPNNNLLSTITPGVPGQLESLNLINKNSTTSKPLSKRPFSAKKSKETILTTFSGLPTATKNDAGVNFNQISRPKVEISSSKPGTAVGQRSLLTHGFHRVKSNLSNEREKNKVPPIVSTKKEENAEKLDPKSDILSGAVSYGKIESLTREQIIEQMVKRIVRKSKNTHQRYFESLSFKYNSHLSELDSSTVDLDLELMGEDEEEEDDDDNDRDDDSERTKSKTINQETPNQQSTNNFVKIESKSHTANLQKFISKNNSTMSTSNDTALAFYNQENDQETQEDIYNISPTNPEIPIEVQDSNNNIRKFFCPLKLLRHKIPFFSQVFKNSNLFDPANPLANYNANDLVITVHSDIMVFEMILDYAKLKEDDDDNNQSRSVINTSNILHKLHAIDAKTLTAILVASEHLQMTHFFNTVLEHFIKNLPKIIKQVPNIHIMEDRIFRKLVNYKTNEFLLPIYDNLNQSKAQQKIFKYLAEELVKKKAQDKNCGLYKCRFCNKILTKVTEDYWECSNSKVDYKGKIINSHSIDKEWNLNAHLHLLFKSQDIGGFDSNWKTLFWHLWALITSFSDEKSKCIRCNKRFQAIALNTCLNHESSITYESQVSADGAKEARIGVYACCNQRAYRFNVGLTSDVQRGGCKNLGLGMNYLFLLCLKTTSSRKQNNRHCKSPVELD